VKTSFLTDIRDTLVPRRDSRHGPLPPLLVSMTMVTGLVDPFSYLPGKADPAWVRARA
jgi:hypothetical protein